MKKFFSLLLCLAMALGAVGALAESDSILIGVEIYDPTDQEFLAMQDYFDNYLAPAMNVSFMYSEAITDADGEFAFIDNCAAAGCVAVIGYYNIAGVEAGYRTMDAGMYYISTGNQDIYEELKNEDLYLCGITYGENGDYAAGKAVGEALANAGCKKVVFSNGGADFGVQMFIDRAAGFMDGIGDAEVITVSGFPGTDAFSSQQNSALTTEGVDGVATSFNALSAWVQPVTAAGLDVPIATIGAVTEEFVSAMEDGLIDCVVAANIERYGLLVAPIYQAVNGNEINAEDGSAPLIEQPWLTFTDAETIGGYYALSASEHVYNAEEIMNCATYEQLMALAGSYELADVQARHAA